MSKHAGKEKTLVNPQQFGKHASKMLATVETPRGGEDQTNPHEVRLAPNIEVPKNQR